MPEGRGLKNNIVVGLQKERNEKKRKI